jgi:hypothetical protein
VATLTPGIAAELACHDARALTERRSSPLMGVFYRHLLGMQLIAAQQ